LRAAASGKKFVNNGTFCLRKIAMDLRVVTLSTWHFCPPENIYKAVVLVDPRNQKMCRQYKYYKKIEPEPNAKTSGKKLTANNIKFSDGTTSIKMSGQRSPLKNSIKPHSYRSQRCHDIGYRTTPSLLHTLWNHVGQNLIVTFLYAPMNQANKSGSSQVNNRFQKLLPRHPAISSKLVNKGRNSTSNSKFPVGMPSQPSDSFLL